MKTIKIGNTQYNVAAIAGMTKKDFADGHMKSEAAVAKDNKGYKAKTRAHFEEMHDKCVVEAKA